MKNYTIENILNKINIDGNKLPLNIIKTIGSCLHEQWNCTIDEMLMTHFNCYDSHTHTYFHCDLENDSLMKIYGLCRYEDYSSDEEIYIDRTNYWD